MPCPLGVIGGHGGSRGCWTERVARATRGSSPPRPCMAPSVQQRNSPGFGLCSARSIRNSRATHTSFAPEARIRPAGTATAFNPQRPGQAIPGKRGPRRQSLQAPLHALDAALRLVSRSPGTRSSGTFLQSPPSQRRCSPGSGRVPEPTSRNAGRRRRVAATSDALQESRHPCTEYPRNAKIFGPTNRRRSRRHGPSCLGLRVSHAFVGDIQRDRTGPRHHRVRHPLRAGPSGCHEKELRRLGPGRP